MLNFDIDFFIKFLTTLFFVSLLSYGCYYRITKNSAFSASFLLFGTGVFIVIYFLHSVDMSMGFAFGLFAVFTMLRYRTESISIKEMTYLFLVIAIALLTAVADVTTMTLLIVNGLICATAFIVELQIFNRPYASQTIQYEKIENIKPERRHILISDLRERTGLDIIKVSISHIDFLRDTANIVVTHKIIPDIPSQQTSTHVPFNTANN